jgi:hypothetical protein
VGSGSPTRTSLGKRLNKSMHKISRYVFKDLLLKLSASDAASLGLSSIGMKLVVICSSFFSFDVYAFNLFL